MPISRPSVQSSLETKYAGVLGRKTSMENTNQENAIGAMNGEVSEKKTKGPPPPAPPAAAAAAAAAEMLPKDGDTVRVKEEKKSDRDEQNSDASNARPQVDPIKSSSGGAENKNVSGAGRKQGKKKDSNASSKATTTKVFKGTSVYRGVAQHRVTKRWESHVWENKKQIYLGSFATEEQAARAYDKAAIFLKKDHTSLNFALADYAGEVQKIEKMTKEKLLAHLRRESNGFSRGKTRFRGVSYRAHTGRWEARISGIEANKYTYLGTFDKPEEAAVAYDRAAIALKGKQAVTNYDIQDYEAELGHLTDMTPDELGKDSLTTRIAVQANKEAYYKDIVARGKKQGRVPASATAIINRVKSSLKGNNQNGNGNGKKQSRKLTRQTTFSVDSSTTTAVTKKKAQSTATKKKPSKRDRSFNSDIKCQEAYAPIAKVVGRGGRSQHQGRIYPSDHLSWPICDQYQFPFIPGQSSAYSDQTGSLGFEEPNHNLSRHPFSRGLESQHLGSGFEGGSYQQSNILPGMVRPAHDMDIPITAYRSDQCFQAATQSSGFLQNGIPTNACYEDFLEFPDDKFQLQDLRGRDSVFPGSRPLSEVNSTDNNNAADPPEDFGYSAKSEFDLYVEKLLDLDKEEIDKGVAKINSKNAIEENLSAFLNNISLNDIPEIQEGDEEVLATDDKALLDIQPVSFL